MWNVQIQSNEGGVASVSATNGSFSWSAIIKVGDLATFVQTAKNELIKYQELHEEDDGLKTDLEALLNK